VNQWAADHTTTLAGGRPILALDMYEHSYHMDYGAKAAALCRWVRPSDQLDERSALL
jgi:Fe-Mn family superoxide dismutase